MPTPVIFLADAGLTGAAAWFLACAGGHGRRGFLEAALAWLWSATALVAGAGVALGITGGFGPAGFLAVHAGVLAVLLATRRGRLGADLAALRAAREEARALLNAPGGERLLAGGLFLVLAALTLVDLGAQPEVLDALTYHLPRLAHWLQDGRIGMLATPDLRFNYVAVLPEVVMAWLAGGVEDGFRTVVLAQALGGIMAVGATVGLARQSGLGRSASLMAGGLLFGMACVAVQFTSAQTDLLTTGILAASFTLWLAALRRGEASPLGAMGAGMALAAKGTLFYLAPGALLWVAWLSWKHPVPWARVRTLLLFGALGVAVFALPGFVRNWRAYGSALGPRAWVKMHHQGFDSVSGQAHKVYWNLTSALAQNLEPQSQPLGLRSAARSAGAALVRLLPAEDAYTYPGILRRAALERILERDRPDADVASFGSVTLLMFSLGAALALATCGRQESRLILVWSAGTAVFVLFYLLMQQWHPYGFRYLVLAAPWIAVVGAWGIEQLGRPLRRVAWVLVGLASLDVGWRVTTQTSQAGWQSVVNPEGYVGYLVASGWGAWSAHLDHAEDPFVVALPEQRPISGFYRQLPRRQVRFKADPGGAGLTAEAFVRGEKGWVVVPAARFLGREGRVAASVWLLGGDESDPYSVAAYRTLAAGELPNGVVYRQRRTVTPAGVFFDLLVKPAGGRPVQVALSNPGAGAVGYAWATPIARGHGVLAPGASVAAELALPGGGVSEVTLAFSPGAGTGGDAGLPAVEVRP